MWIFRSILTEVKNVSVILMIISNYLFLLKHSDIYKKWRLWYFCSISKYNSEITLLCHTLCSARCCSILVYSPVICLRDWSGCWIAVGTPVSWRSSGWDVLGKQSLRPPWYNCVCYGPGGVRRQGWTWHRLSTVQLCSRAHHIPCTVGSAAPRPSTSSGRGSDRGEVQSLHRAL